MYIYYIHIHTVFPHKRILFQTVPSFSSDSGDHRRAKGRAKGRAEGRAEGIAQAASGGLVSFPRFGTAKVRDGT